MLDESAFFLRILEALIRIRGETVKRVIDLERDKLVHAKPRRKLVPFYYQPSSSQVQHRDRGRNAYGQQRAKRGREERSGGARETPPDPTLHVPRFPGLVLFSPSLDLDTRLKMDELIVSRFRLKRFKMEYLDR